MPERWLEELLARGELGGSMASPAYRGRESEVRPSSFYEGDGGGEEINKWLDRIYSPLSQSIHRFVDPQHPEAGLPRRGQEMAATRRVPEPTIPPPDRGWGRSLKPPVESSTYQGVDDILRLLFGLKQMEMRPPEKPIIPDTLVGTPFSDPWGELPSYRNGRLR